MKKVISTSQAPAAIGPYSQAIKVGNLLFASGQIPISPATGSIVSGDIKEQTRQALNNIKAIFEEAGLTINDVVKTTVFLTNMEDFSDMNSILCRILFRALPCTLCRCSKNVAKRGFDRNRGNRCSGLAASVADLGQTQISH